MGEERGRSHLLTWYTKEDRILSKKELNKLLAKAKRNPERMKDESKHFWLMWSMIDKGEKPKVVKDPPKTCVPEDHLLMFRRWRKGLNSNGR